MRLDPYEEELLELGADHAVKRPDGTLAVHRAASSPRSSGPPEDAASQSAANCTKFLIQASEGGAGTSTLDAASEAGTPFLMACSRQGTKQDWSSHTFSGRGEGGSASIPAPTLLSARVNAQWGLNP